MFLLDTIQKRDRIIRSSFLTFMYHTPPFHVCTLKDISAYALKAHYKDFPQIWYCRSGEYTHETEHGLYHCKQGSAVIVPPGVLHSISVPRDATATIVQIDLTFDYLANVPFEAAPNTANMLFLPAFCRQAGIPIPEYYSLSEASATVAEQVISTLSSDEQEESSKRASLEHMLSLPEFSLPDTIKEKAAAEARTKLYPTIHALTYLHANYSQKITAEQLCKETSLCRTNLFAFIRQYLGISYCTYLTMIRVFRANCALVQTNYSIAYISDMCGFSHSSHMSKYYKKYKGILPRTDRAKQKEYQQRYGKLHITHEYFLDSFYD